MSSQGPAVQKIDKEAWAIFVTMLTLESDCERCRVDVIIKQLYRERFKYLPWLINLTSV